MNVKVKRSKVENPTVVLHTWHSLDEFPEGCGLLAVGEYGRVPQRLLPLVRFEDRYGNISAKRGREGGE